MRIDLKAVGSRKAPQNLNHIKGILFFRIRVINGIGKQANLPTRSRKNRRAADGRGPDHETNRNRNELNHFK